MFFLLPLGSGMEELVQHQPNPGLLSPTTRKKSLALLYLHGLGPLVRYPAFSTSFVFRLSQLLPVLTITI